MLWRHPRVMEVTKDFVKEQGDRLGDARRLQMEWYMVACGAEDGRGASWGQTNSALMPGLPSTGG